MLIDFLQDFCKLTNSEQRVFLYCLKKCPFPRSKTDDLNSIAYALGLSYKSVWRAVHAFKLYPQFNRLVKYIHSDILPEPDKQSYFEFSTGGQFARGEEVKNVFFDGSIELENVFFDGVVKVFDPALSLTSPPIKINCIDNQGLTTNNFTFQAWKESFYCSVPGGLGGADLGATPVALYSPTPRYVEKRF
jgi:hypothetical protein